MIALIQRVTRARVDVAGECVGEIGPGLLALVAVRPADDPASAARLLERLLGYRVFADAAGRMNRSLAETGQLNRKLVCRTFSYCTGLMRAKNHPLGQYPTGCPPFDKEAYGDLWKEVEQQRKLASSGPAVSGAP